MSLIKSITAVVALIISCLVANAQSGCTDPAATNYNSAATVNDGSCVYPVTHYNPKLRAAFGTGITESSGLVWTDGKLWTHNDSGNPSDIFSVDTTTGAILQTVHIDNYPNTDWEDITADSNYIYVGDFGNNNGNRTDLKILKIAKADITTASVVHVNAQVISFSYADQTSFVSNTFSNYDCEAMISVRDSIYVFTKDWGDNQTRVYKLPKTPGTYAVSPYTSYNVAGLITGASYNPVTKEIALIGYVGIFSNSFIWFLYDYQGDMFFSGNKRRIEIGNGGFWQTEGISYAAGGRFFVSCESAGGIPSSLFIGDRGLGWPAGVASVRNNKTAAIYPNPTTGRVQIDNLKQNTMYSIYSRDGKVVQYGTLGSGSNTITIYPQAAGEYLMVLSGGKEAERFRIYKQ